MRWCWLVMLGAVGCGTDKTETTETTPTAETGTDSGTTTVTVPVGPVARLSGTISYAGAPGVGADTRLCRGTQCRYGTTDATGVYTFGNLPPDSYSLEIVPDEGSGVATWFAPVELEGDTKRAVDVVMLDYDQVNPLTETSQEFPAGNGLHITLSSTAIESALAIAPPATEVGGARVPEAQWPPFDGITGTVLAVWFVDPFDFLSVSEAGLPTRFDNEWALADGTQLKAYVGSYVDSAWLPAGTATVSGKSITGAALPLIGTVILVQE